MTKKKHLLKHGYIIKFTIPEDQSIIVEDKIDNNNIAYYVHMVDEGNVMILGARGGKL